MAHSFSVEEIQKVKTQLKSSKSYPNDFLKKQSEIDEVVVEDGDNSSSGVSSDQEIPSGAPATFDDRLPNEHSSATMTLPSPKTQQSQRPQMGMLTRHAVSLAQLPPPIEADADEKDEIFVPPPPEFVESTSGNTQTTPEAVLAPPPQFSDNRQVTRVRIVGAVPKGPGPKQLKQGRLHSQ